jgi:hypothetical protein
VLGYLFVFGGGWVLFLSKKKKNKIKNDNFDASADAHFDYSSLFSDAKVEKVGNPKKR